ncbi:unnamed protein product, partial [Iphiclides podalirius]
MSPRRAPCAFHVTGNRDRVSQQIQIKLGDYHLAQTLLDDPSKSIGICAEPPSPAPLGRVGITTVALMIDDTNIFRNIANWQRADFSAHGAIAYIVAPVWDFSPALSPVARLDGGMWRPYRRFTVSLIGPTAPPRLLPAPRELIYYL